MHLETITAYFEKRSIGNYFLILESGFFLETINRNINWKRHQYSNWHLFYIQFKPEKTPQFAPEII